MNPEPTVFIVDDDLSALDSVRWLVQTAGLRAETFSSPTEFLEALDGPKPGCLVLDIRMPEMNGLDLQAELSARRCSLPIIIVTGHGDVPQCSRAFHQGEFDFIEKSRSFSIVLKRISLIGGRQAASEEEPPEVEQHIGKLELRHDCKRASWDGKQVNLTVTEFDIVSLLINKGGSDASYREIYDLVHGEGFIAGIDGEGHRVNVRTFIKRIRRKFRAVDESFGHIENYPAFGYRWRPE